MTNRTTLRIASLLVPVALMVACGPEDLSPEERAQLAAQQAGGDFRPAPSPTNAVANDGDAVALGVLLPVAGILGDLVESMLKRAAGSKDSGTLIRGMGGVLDLIDSLLLASPLLYIYLRTVTM